MTCLRFVLIFLTSFSMLIEARELNNPPKTQIFSEENLLNDGSFIIPNEFNNYSQYNRLPKHLEFNSTVISVGSIRAFNLVGVMKRDLLITLDYDVQVRNFNETLANLIRVSTRGEFLKAIFGLRSLGTSREEIAFGYISYAPQFSTQEEQKFSDFFMPRNISDPTTKSGGELTIWKKLWPVLDSRTRQELVWRSWQESLRKFANSEQSWKSTFFGSDEAYDHVRTLIKSGRFFSIGGSLSGDRSLRAISQFLKNNNYWVSEIDISNALEHIYKYEKYAGLQKFIDNIANLPHNSSAQILSTHNLTTESATQLTASDPGWQSDWAYRITPFKKTKALAQELISAEEVTSPKLSDSLLRCNSLFK